MFSPRTVLSSLSRAVMKMMGMEAVEASSLSRRAIWKPDISPIITSSRMSA